MVWSERGHDSRLGNISIEQAWEYYISTSNFTALNVGFYYDRKFQELQTLRWQTMAETYSIYNPCIASSIGNLQHFLYRQTTTKHNTKFLHSLTHHSI